MDRPRSQREQRVGIFGARLLFTASSGPPLSLQRRLRHVTELVVENLRGGVLESCHRVSAAVVDADGRLVARAGDPELATFMRSAAKPFQALPLLVDGAADHFEVTPQELALACASHNSERYQVALVRAWLERIRCVEGDLACGAHAPLSVDYAIMDGKEKIETDPPSRLASNCSGKHTGMLTLARHHDWPIAGYHRSDHPVQHRVKRELARWCRVSPTSLPEGTDGCGVVTFALPLSAMAAALARLVTSSDAGPKAVVSAMSTHPDLVAGHGRLCTALMEAYPHKLIAKVGAEGVYVAGLIDRGWGLALKVEDGHGKAAMVAVVRMLDRLDLEPSPTVRLPSAAAIPIRNTRDEGVGEIRARGDLTFV